MEQQQPQRFVIEADEAKSTAEKAGLTVAELLPSIVESAMPLARPPISSFHVAAAGLASDGRIFVGVNVEFPGLPLHHSIHAEQFLVVNAALHGCSGLSHLAVSASPCGHCRQFLHELPRPSDISVFISSSGGGDRFPLCNLLPRSFGPSDLIDPTPPLLLHTPCNDLRLLTGGNEDGLEEAERGAMEAAKESYAPYSGCRSGAAVVDGEGMVHRGWYIESAAHNPSVGPVQAALVAYIVRSKGGSFEGISRAVVAERAAGAVKQVETAGLLLRAVAPGCQLSVVHFQ